MDINALCRRPLRLGDCEADGESLSGLASCNSPRQPAESFVAVLPEKVLIKSVYFTKQLDRVRETGTKVSGLNVYLTQNNNIKLPKRNVCFGNFSNRPVGISNLRITRQATQNQKFGFETT